MWQTIDPVYSNVDPYMPSIREKGVILAQLSRFERPPESPGAFFTDADIAEKHGRDAAKVADACQLAGIEGNNRQFIHRYRLTVDTGLAAGLAETNSDFGPGGAHQYVIAGSKQERAARLEYVDTVYLDNWMGTGKNPILRLQGPK